MACLPKCSHPSVPLLRRALWPRRLRLRGVSSLRELHFDEVVYDNRPGILRLQQRPHAGQVKENGKEEAEAEAAAEAEAEANMKSEE